MHELTRTIFPLASRRHLITAPFYDTSTILPLGLYVYLNVVTISHACAWGHYKTFKVKGNKKNSGIFRHDSKVHCERPAGQVSSTLPRNVLRTEGGVHGT